jgi:vacuolar-type H+-ATPase subunit I/STV1
MVISGIATEGASDGDKLSAAGDTTSELDWHLPGVDVAIGSASAVRRLLLLGVLLLGVLGPAASSQASSSGHAAAAISRPQLVAFHGFHFGGGGFGRRGFGFGGFGHRRSTHILRRVAHALLFAYLLHLFFSHGGLSILIWLMVIAFVVHLVRRGRRRRDRYF